MVEVGKEPWRRPGPNSLHKQDYHRQVVQDHVQPAFEYLQGQSLQNYAVKILWEKESGPLCLKLSL